MAGMGWRTLVRDGVIAGLVATTAMNASYWAERGEPAAEAAA